VFCSAVHWVGSVAMVSAEAGENMAILRRSC